MTRLTWTRVAFCGALYHDHVSDNRGICLMTDCRRSVFGVGIDRAIVLPVLCRETDRPIDRSTDRQIYTDIASSEFGSLSPSLVSLFAAEAPGAVTSRRRRPIDDDDPARQFCHC